MDREYKVVETAAVTDETLSAILNEWTGQGWTLESIQFAMGQASRRPAMAFVIFVREGARGESGARETGM
jgi:hypothetical protein